MARNIRCHEFTKNQREKYDNTHHTNPQTNVFTKKNGVSGIITMKPHRVVDKQRDCIDQIIMAVLDRNNDMIYK